MLAEFVATGSARYRGGIAPLGPSKPYGPMRARVGDSTCAVAIVSLKSWMAVMRSLGNRMPSVAANLGTIADGVIGGAVDIIAVRDISGDVRGHPIHFAREAKGVWRIDFQCERAQWKLRRHPFVD